MKRAVLGIVPVSFALCVAFSQSADAPPKFVAADVHVSAKSQNPFMRTAPVRAGRYEIKSATMVDLIHVAYNFDNDKILGGPSWLEMNHYDVTAKVPAESTPDSLKLMLQELLADRFKLVIHSDSKKLPTYALVAGKKPLLKESEGTEDSGCKPQAQSMGLNPGGDGGGGPVRIMLAARSDGGGGDSAPMTFSLGPGGTVQYACRNMTMDAFASGLRTMFGASLGPNPVLNETGLKGKWNFDVRWTVGMFPMLGNANQGDRVTIFEAMEKQLGLKLEERQVATPVMVVDSVNEQPSANPPGTSDILPVTPAPTEFEVASVKPADANGKGPNVLRPMSGGRFTSNGLPMRFLLMQAFNVNNSDQIAGMPAWADSERFDITAKAPGDLAVGTTDRELLPPMLRSLLADRFKMTYHTEDRPISAYTLVASKPKLKKADPASRTSCRIGQAPPGAPPGTRVLTCQNVTMEQFAERLQGMTPELNWPVQNSTGLEFTYDLTLTFSFSLSMPVMIGRGGDGGGMASGAGPAAPSDPSGGLSLFEAIEKQLGLKLEKQKRTAAVIVIDHLEQKPTEN